jgi:hypothetical protein
MPALDPILRRQLQNAVSDRLRLHLSRLVIRSGPVVFLQSLRLDGFLSFAPGSPARALGLFDVPIAPNASGKFNLIEAIELLRATLTVFAQGIRNSVDARERVLQDIRAHLGAAG